MDCMAMGSVLHCVLCCTDKEDKDIKKTTVLNLNLLSTFTDSYIKSTRKISQLKTTNTFIHFCLRKNRA